MKKLFALSLTLILTAVGCLAPQTKESYLADIRDTAELGTTALLLESPGSLKDVERLSEVLFVLETRTNLDIQTVVDALKAAGVDELDSPKARVYVSGGRILLRRAGLVVDLANYEDVQLIARALREGVDAGLGR